MPERYTRRRLTDRKDGRRLRTISPLFQLSPFTMLTSADAASSFTDSVDAGPVEAWLRERRRNGDESVTLLHVVIAAYVRTVALRPAMNRFVAGRFIYARNNIDVILAPGGSGGADTSGLDFTVRFHPGDTVADVVRKIEARAENLQADRSADRYERVAATLVKTPRFLLRAAIGVLRWLDSHGWLPASFTDKSPWHGSAVISDEGAFHLPPVRRSLNGLGALPVTISVGRVRTVTEPGKDGAPAERKYIDFSVTYDCRVADSAYVGSAFRYFRYFLANPSALEFPPDRVNEDSL